MPSAIVNGQQIDIAEPDDWTTRELYEAEKALGLAYDGSSAGAAMALTMFISLHRADPEKPMVLLADEVMGMRFNQLLPDVGDDARPPDVSANGDHADRPSIGPPP
jgi:hypothetical protein